MNKQVLACLSILVATAAATSLASEYRGEYGLNGEHSFEHHIDWCRDNSDDECLCNKINLLGPKIVLVNLDDHCLLDAIEDEGGIFI